MPNRKDSRLSLQATQETKMKQVVMWLATFALAVGTYTLAHAGTVTVNGQACGSLSVASINSLGDVSISTASPCGTVPTPIPPDPTPNPVPKPTCPANTVCIDRPFPVIPQEIVSLRNGQVLSVHIKSPVAGIGYISTMITAQTTAARIVELSTQPVMGTTAGCSTQGFEATSLKWEVGGTGIRVCKLPPSADLYINIKPTNCPDGQACKIYLKAN